MAKASKLVLFTHKTKIRWFSLDSNTLKNLHFSDNTSEGSIAVSTIVEVRPHSSHPVLLHETKHHFEIEVTGGNSYAFGCADAVVKKHWLTALQTAVAKYLVSISSYKRRLDESDNRMSMDDVINFADQFKKQGALFSSITSTKQQVRIDDYGFNEKDVSEVSQYLHNLMLAAGLNSKLLEIFHEFVLIAPADAQVWEVIRNGVRKIRKQLRSSKERPEVEDDLSCLEECFDVDEVTSNSFGNQLHAKINGTGSLYAEVSRLAMIAVSKEQENKDLLDRIRKLEEQYINQNSDKKKIMRIEEAVEKLKLTRMQQKIKELEEFFASDQVRIEKLNEKIRQLEDEMEDLKNKHSQEIKLIHAEWEKKLAASVQRAEELAKSSAHVVAGAGTTGKEADDPYAKYRKMAKLLPEAAVRQRMNLEGVSETDIDAFFAQRLNSTGRLSASTPDIVESTEDKFEKYRKMRKNKLPEGAIRQCMSRDGYKEDEIESFLSKQEDVPVPASAAVPSTIAAGSSAATATVSDPALERYHKMLKVLPEVQVRHKMTVDGVDPEVITRFFQGGEMSASAPVAAATSASSMDNSKFEKYRKMKTLLPDAVVRHKMLAEGCTPAEIDSFLSGTAGAGLAGGTAAPKKPSESAPPEGMQEKVLSVKPPHKLKPFFWEKMRTADIKETLFYLLPDFSIPASVLTLLDDLYAAKGAALSNKPSDPSNGLTRTSSGQIPKLISVVDSKRVQTLLIVMSKLKLEPEAVMQIIIDLNPDVLTHDVTVSLTSILPTSDEANAVKCHSDPSTLDQASRLFFHMCRIPHLATRLECHEIAFTWFPFLSSVHSQVRVVVSACEEVILFEGHMREVFAIVLSLGNYLNAETKFGGAYGFKLETINKLEFMKDVKSGSLLNCLAELVKQFAPEALTQSEKWLATSAASCISFQQIVGDVDKLEDQVSKMKKELAKIKETETNVGLDGALETHLGVVTHPLFQRLTHFLNEAAPKLAELKNQVSDAQNMVKELMAKYGETFELNSEEDAGKLKSKEEETIKFKFFHTINNFLRKLRIAAEENQKAKRAAERTATRRASELMPPKAKAAATAAGKENKDAKEKGLRKPTWPLRELPAPPANANNAVITPASNLVLTPLQKSKSKRLNTAGHQKNLFNNFHSDHETTTEAAVTEFIRQPR